MFGCGIGGLSKRFSLRNKHRRRRTTQFEQFDSRRIDCASSACSDPPEDEESPWAPIHRPITENLKHVYSMRDGPPPITVNPNDVYFGNSLGKGVSGTVYRGRLEGEEVAIKIIRPKDSVFELGTEPLELYMGQDVSHPNLVKVLGVYVGSDRESDVSTEFQERDMSIYESPEPGVRRTSSSLFSDMAQDLSDGPAEIWIVMEYCNKGSLRDAIKRGEFFEDAKRERPRILHILFAALEVAAALEHLHAFGVIHGDLKSQNVMLATSQILAKNFVCKVGDFGMSRPLTQIKTHISTFTAGTVSHMPPEVLKDGILTPAVDVFSFGMLLWELMSGELPFIGMNAAETMVSIVDGDRPQIPDYTPPMYADLIKRCWNPRRELRPTFKDITRMLKTMLGGPPIQSKGIPAALSNSDIHGAMPTGSSEIFSEGETTLYGTTTDLSDNCLSGLQDRSPSRGDHYIEDKYRTDSASSPVRTQPSSMSSPMRTPDSTRVSTPDPPKSESSIPRPPKIYATHKATDGKPISKVARTRRGRPTAPFPQWQAYLDAINEANKAISRPRTKIPTSSSCPPAAQSTFDRTS